MGGATSSVESAVLAGAGSHPAARVPHRRFLDHSFHEVMFGMLKKVNAREKLVGWYSTGPKIRPGDLKIDQLVRRYCAHPVMVIIDVKPKDLGIPTEAYYGVEEILEGKQQSWTFTHVPCEIGATEPEEVGVEHLLRDVKDTTISTLANQVSQKLGSLKGLAARLNEVDAYLQNVLSGRLPVNHRIIYQLQVAIYTDTHRHRYINLSIYLSTYLPTAIYLYIVCIYICVCIYVCIYIYILLWLQILASQPHEKEREREREK